MGDRHRGLCQFRLSRGGRCGARARTSDSFLHAMEHGAVPAVVTHAPFGCRPHQPDQSRSRFRLPAGQSVAGADRGALDIPAAEAALGCRHSGNSRPSGPRRLLLDRAAEPLRALHVIAGLDAADGGPSYSVPALCRSLARYGADIRLFSVGGRDLWLGDDSVSEYSERRFVQNCRRVPIAQKLRWSAELGAALKRAGPDLDIIHNHGVWLMPNVQAGRAAIRSGLPLVVSPRGMFGTAALQFSRNLKRVFWAVAQGPAIRGAACLHATSEQEYKEIRAFGLSNPVAVIPNGIDVTDQGPMPREGRKERVVLSLGRLHPKKGLDGLVQ